MKEQEIRYGRTYIRITGKGRGRRNHARTILCFYFPHAHQQYVLYERHDGDLGKGDCSLSAFARWAEREVKGKK